MKTLACRRSDQVWLSGLLGTFLYWRSDRVKALTLSFFVWRFCFGQSFQWTSLTPISGLGTAVVSPSLSLSSVLLVPSFPSNPLSVSSLNCCLTFYLIIVFWRTGRTIGGVVKLMDCIFWPQVAIGIRRTSPLSHKRTSLCHFRLGHPPLSVRRSVFPYSSSVKFKLLIFVVVLVNLLNIFELSFLVVWVEGCVLLMLFILACGDPLPLLSLVVIKILSPE